MARQIADLGVYRMAVDRRSTEFKRGNVIEKAHGIAANSEWPLDRMPSMPLDKGLAMVRSATMEMTFYQGTIDQALDRQHVLAAYESARKWEAEQSRLNTEAAKRFRIRAAGWAKLRSAFGLGSIITFVIMYIRQM